MKFDAFIGGSYQSQAVTADQELTVNWYPEILESPGATAQKVLYPTPGVEAITSDLTGQGRAHFSGGGREFAIIGATLWEVARNGAVTNRGQIALDNRPATICTNGDGGNQLFVTSGRYGYVYDLGTNIVTQIAALNRRASQGDYLDSRFLCLNAETSTFYFSAQYDGATWDIGNNIAQRSLAADPWRALKVVSRYIWLFGEYTTEIWQDTGRTTFPFEANAGVLITFGIAAPGSVAIVGNDLMWLGQTVGGRVCVLRVTGSSGALPSIVSSKPLESAIEAYQSVDEATADSYSEKGHTFYLLHFDKANQTWAYDVETQLWHNRGTWLSELSRFASWRPRFYAFAYGEHRILDASGGIIYRMSGDLATDVGGLHIRRMRRAPALMDEDKRIFYTTFELDLEPGLGLPTAQASFRIAPGSYLAVDYAMAPDPTQVPVNVNTEITFTPTVTPGVPPYTYSWDFGDGSDLDANEIPTHTYNDPMTGGTYTCTLTVTDNDGFIATKAYTFDIQGV